MTLSAAELVEAGLALPPSARKNVALRLLESVEVADDEFVDEGWTEEISSRVDDLVSGRVKTILGEQVFSRIDERLDAREASRNG